LFERAGVRLKCEVRVAMNGDGFELVWTNPTGEIRVERSHDPAVLAQRRQQLQDLLKVDGWTRVGRVTPPRAL